MRRRPCEARLAPTDSVEAPRAQRPTDGTSKSCKQRDAGNRAPRIVAVDAAQGSERGVIKPKSHADAENEPSGRHHSGGVRKTQHNETTGQNEVRRAQNFAPTHPVDLPSDARTQQARNHKRGRKRGEYPIA